METTKTLTPEERYSKELEAHEKFIKDYRFFLDRIVRHLKHLEETECPDAWTSDEINRVITREIDMASHCDAPNRPGYYRANND